MNSIDQLPMQFLPYAEKIASTKTSSINIELQQENSALLWKSRLGGIPYLPLNVDYPKSKLTNRPLQFLAQINFSELPTIQNFPSKGILQFYLDMTSMGLGVDESLDQVQFNHRVLYFPEVIEDDTQLQKSEDLKVLSEIDENEIEFWMTPSQLKFNLMDQYITFFDYRFAPLLFDREQVAISDDYDDLMYAYVNYQQPYTEQFQIEGGHRIGGYPNFLHSTDHRIEFAIKDYILLLQLDTDVGLEWGDSGIAHWFIHPEDLVNNNFSKVVFLWTCH